MGKQTFFSDIILPSSMPTLYLLFPFIQVLFFSLLSVFQLFRKFVLFDTMLNYILHAILLQKSSWLGIIEEVLLINSALFFEIFAHFEFLT